MEVIKGKRGTRYKETVRINRKKVSRTFSRKTDAKNWKAKMLTQKSEGAFSGVNPNILNQKITFGEYCNIWIERVKQAKARRTYESYRDNLRIHFLPILKDIPLHRITRQDGEEIIDVMYKKKLVGKGINLKMGIAKSVLNEACRDGYIRQSPWAYISRVKEMPTEDAFWTRKEIHQFLEANKNDQLISLYVIAFNTGMRRGELLGLKWDAIDFDRKFIAIKRIRDIKELKDTTKTGRIRYIPMNSEVESALLETKKRYPNSEFVFCIRNGRPVNPNHMYRYFAKAQYRANMERKIRFHDIRHTFASNFVMSGNSLYDLQKLLGHSKSDMTQRYAHLSPDHLKGVMDNFSLGKSSTGSVSRVSLNCP